ncbi:cytochrome c peroxidase [Flexibacter flexilis DSM 6793]|uniref:Cytochrome c peroxidase n=1 Tax=Flexibacter flexilis DSM 6793 TaxID=927664 RepID=A0A1I1DV58_9BACT|nr:cytochrome c peroxidase [Flexibacter flexilis]SFB78276.1 cytochrome c peroxidase [Flexibacter flexilis DSM 6793]
MKKITLQFIVLVVVMASCMPDSKKSGQAAAQPSSLEADKQLLKDAQSNFQPLAATADNPENPITPAKVELGQVLYYDTRLSKTGNNSCNSCHNLATFGVDTLPTSKGDAGKFGTRNSPTVLNAAFHSIQFWDGRAKDVEEQAGMPILNPVEMAIPNQDFLVKKLKGIKEYQPLFSQAFPEDKNPVSYANIQKAIGAFERTLVTPTAFDRYLGGEMYALSTPEREGLRAFMETGCTSCHSGANLGGTMLQKFGVFADYHSIANFKTKDEGRKEVTKAEADKDMFKVPSLRNVGKTYPYFHDGSVRNLEEAVKIMAKLQLNKELSDEKAKSIVEFLHSLTGEVPESAKQVPAILKHS